MGCELKKVGIIGGGPAGYALALKLAMGGVYACVFEKNDLGGTCLNKGCIPTKSILYNANLINKSKNLTRFGLKIDASELDFSQIVENKDKIVGKLNKSLELLLKSYGIEIVKDEVISFGSGKIDTSSNSYNFDAIVLATGTKPSVLKGIECDNKFVFDSDGILNLTKLPKSIAIVGSGAIGIEWSRIFADLGVEVTLIEAMACILPMADYDVSSRVERILKKKRVKIEKGVTLKSLIKNKLELSNGKIIEPQSILVAVGRLPVLPKNDLGLKVHKGFLCVDENFMTSQKNIYAIGDINGLSLLAHSATHQAIELSQYLLEQKTPDFSKKIIPSVVYGTPEVAWFGQREQDLIECNAQYKRVLFPVSAVGKAHADEEIEGFIKLLVNGEKLLGVHIVAPEAASLLMQFLILKENNLSYKLLHNVVFPHPTFSEAVYEATLALDNMSLSLPKNKD